MRNIHAYNSLLKEHSYIRSRSKNWMIVNQHDHIEIYAPNREQRDEIQNSELKHEIMVQSHFQAKTTHHTLYS